jgi:hypothetical protein
MRKTVNRLILIAPIALLGGCQTIVTTPPADCADYIPAAWKEPVPGAPLPATDTVQDWQKFGVAQTGQLSKANGRSSDILHIFGTCEAKANKARPRKKFLGLF